jgi:CubicO group peptidase (beta-lactamase class C family)
MKPVHTLFVLLLLTLCVHAQDAPLQGFDDYAAQAMKAWDVPGFAIAVVKDDKVVFAKGYGVRELGKAVPVNERTMFAIGSSSKAFTAAAIAMLVDDGKVKWDDPVTKHLPAFQVYDTYASREMTLRDLLCHRSGLERGDLMWYGSAFSRDEIVRRVRYLKPSWSFRSNFGYQNIMYLAAGQAAAAAAGRSWDDIIKERIFKPLGMTASNTSISDLKGHDNVATPHAKLEDKVTAVAWRNIDNIAPAGSINSNVVEMANWVRLQLGEGKFQGAQIISSGAAKEMHQSHTIIRSEPPWSLFYPEAHFLSYGLGWFLHDYKGRKVVEHGGNIDGMSALVTMIPEEKLGIVLLTNMNGTQLPHALTYRVYDAYLNAPPKDWSANLLKTMKTFQGQAEEAQKKQIEARVKDTKPSLALGQYAGTYQDEMYGEFKVTEAGGKLMASTGQAFVGELEHWHYDTFQAKWRDPMAGKMLVTFTINEQGKVGEVKLPGMATFRRVPDKAPPAAAIAMSEADMKKFTGKYTIQGTPIDISVEIVGGKLKATVPGQPTYTLTPVAPTRFQIEGAPAGFLVGFEVADGKVKSGVLEQGPGPKMNLVPKP